MSPSWLDVLAAECRRTSQSAAADRIGVSEAVVSQVLKGKYPGRVDRVQARVEGALMAQTVTCPILGDLQRNECLDHQVRPFAATNSQRVALWRMCKTCPNSEGAKA